MKANRHVFTAALIVLGLASLLLPASAGAATWTNAGPFTLEATGGFITVGTTLPTFSLTPNPLPQCSDGVDNDADGKIDYPVETGCSSPDDDAEVKSGFQPKQDVSISGTINASGVVSIPQANIQFPVTYTNLGDPSFTIITARVLPTAAATGVINPDTGAANVTVRVRIKIEGTVAGNAINSACYIGTTSTPIVLNLTTGIMPAIGTQPVVVGIPYNQTNGTATMVDNAFTVPGASGCIYNGFIPADGAINDVAGLPSLPGKNNARLGGRTTPILTTATPTTTTASTTTASTTTTTASTTTTTAPTTTTTASTTTTTAPTTTTTTAPTTTTTAPTTTTTTAPTTTTTAPTTTTTAPTTTTTAPTTTTTAPTTTTTAPTTTTTTPPTGSDSVSVTVTGAVTYANSGSGSGVTILKDAFGIQSVKGQIQIPSTGSGAPATVKVDAQRAWILPLWTGQVSVVDSAAGVSVAAPVFGGISTGSTPGSAKATSSWFVPGTFPNLIRPFTLTWNVTDAG